VGLAQPLAAEAFIPHRNGTTVQRATVAQAPALPFPPLPCSRVGLAQPLPAETFIPHRNGLHLFPIGHFSEFVPFDMSCSFSMSPILYFHAYFQSPASIAFRSEL
jgi:hypothetical protein